MYIRKNMFPVYKFFQRSNVSAHSYRFDCSQYVSGQLRLVDLANLRCVFLLGLLHAHVLLTLCTRASCPRKVHSVVDLWRHNV